jgi:P2-related tail formation protein
MAELTPAPSIADRRTNALMTIIGRLAALDLTPLLVYRIDSVVDEALPFLAWQFDVASPLWQLLSPAGISIDDLADIDSLIDIDNLIAGASVSSSILTSIAQRDLLKQAIALHRLRGTPAAIKRSLNALGWPAATMLEGQNSWGGTQYPGSQGWAAFRVIVHLQPGDSANASDAVRIAAAANFFKPARCRLDSIWFALPAIFDSARPPADLFTLGGIAQYQIDSKKPPSDITLTIAIVTAPVSETYGPVMPTYGAHFQHSGITQGVGEPVVADPALNLNGNPTLNGG